MRIIDILKRKSAQQNQLNQDLADAQKRLQEYEETQLTEERIRKARLSQFMRLSQRWSYNHPDRIDALVRMLTEKITLERGIEAFCGEPEIANLFITDYFFGDNVSNELLELFQKQRLSDTIDVDLSRDAILPSPWNPSRMERGFFDNRIGSDENPFRQDRQTVYVYQPLDIAVVTNGNHSIWCGEYRRSGSVAIKAEYDLTPLYDEMYFDGTYWRRIQGEDSEGIISKAASWEMGLIFELRRPRCR